MADINFREIKKYTSKEHFDPEIIRGKAAAFGWVTSFVLAAVAAHEGLNADSGDHDDDPAKLLMDAKACVKLSDITVSSAVHMR